MHSTVILSREHGEGFFRRSQPHKFGGHLPLEVPRSLDLGMAAHRRTGASPVILHGGTGAVALQMPAA